MEISKLTFLDLFSGIGGFRLGMERAGHECVGWAEWDKFARKSYQAIFDKKEVWNANDIRSVKSDELPRADCWCFGFPCQDISVAGKRQGITKGKRSSLFFTVTSLIRDLQEEDRPSYLFIENVKNLLVLTEGLTSSSFKLNWMKSGMTSNGQFSILPKSFLNTGRGSSLLDILEDEVPEKYFLSDKKAVALLSQTK